MQVNVYTEYAAVRSHLLPILIVSYVCRVTYSWKCVVEQIACIRGNGGCRKGRESNIKVLFTTKERHAWRGERKYVVQVTLTHVIRVRMFLKSLKVQHISKLNLLSIVSRYTKNKFIFSFYVHKAGARVSDAFRQIKERPQNGWV